VKEFIELEKVKTKQLESGIIEIIFKTGCAIEVKDVVELREINLKISKNKPYTVLVQSEDFISFSQEAREFLASRAFMGKTIAKAIVFKSVGQHILAGFYLRVNKPHIKTKIFSSRNKAIVWLREEYKNISE